jgi:hydrophobic/amphiphilic exporter-1 (mainly G- bacteria), HAE1 family
MFLAKLSINRPILTTMLLLVILLFGGISYWKLNLNQMPDVQIPYVSISTVYPGAGPKEIETQITKEIEDVISTVSEIERIESYSMESVSVIIMEFQLSKDVDVANQEVKDKIDAILNELPEDAELPIVQKLDFAAFPFMNIVLRGEQDPRELHRIANKQLKDRFSQIAGVAKVNIIGGQEREIQVNFDNKTVYENSISLPQLMQILNAHNMDIPGGFFKLNDQEFSVRLDGKFPDIETIREIQIPTRYGYKKLSQISNVVDGGKTIRERAVYFNNKTNIRDENVVSIGIIKSPEGNIVDISENVKASLPEINETLPEGTSLEIVNDESKYIKASVEDTLNNILLGIIFTSIILLIFIGDIRSTFIVILSMPTSIISTFLMFSAFDMTLNMLSLMGLSVSVGVLVANSVVVLENIFRHKNMGKGNKRASFDGTSEVTVAVLAASLTNLVVFIPIANMTSMMGLFLAELALAASFATIMSIIMSFTLTPMLASRLLKKDNTRGWFGQWVDRFEQKMSRIYRSILGIVLKRRWYSFFTILISFVLLIVIVVIYAPYVGGELMPSMDNGKLSVTVELPGGYNLDETAKVLKEVENKIKRHKEVDYLLTNLGKKSDVDKGTNTAQMTVQLCDLKNRDKRILEWIPIFTEELSYIPNAKILVQLPNEMGGGDPIEFYVLGQELEKLDKLKEEITSKSSNIEGLINFDNSSREGKPEITITPKRNKLAETGLTAMDIALTIRASIEGLVSTEYEEQNEEYDVLVTLNDKSVNTPEKIANITVVSQAGTFLLSHVADIKFSKSFNTILHRDKYTAIKFSGGNSPDISVANITGEITKLMDNTDFPPGYSWNWGGSTKMMNDMFADMIFTIILAVLLTYMLLAAILESFLQPIFIIVSVLYGFIGVIISMYYFDLNFNMVSLMSIIMLIGIVVNNAILMLDYTNQLRRDEKKKPGEALLIACPTKLKPIIMSTTALILGMLPMALGIGEAGAEMRQTLGIVSIGGLISSTALALLVIPAFYYLFAWKGRYEKEREANV